MASEESKPETRILVIDDDQVDRRAVQRALNGLYSMVEAESGRQALELLATETVDCVLLDYDIPGTDTVALVTEISKQVPVVMLTGQGNESVAVSLMKAGAQDYLSKDGFRPEALDRSIRLAIEKGARLKERHEAHSRLRSEYHEEKKKRHALETAMQVARDIQQNLIPAGPPELAGFDIAGVCLPAEATGGDFFDYVPMSDGTLGLLIGDVSGHGLGPSLLATEIRAHFRALARVSSDIAHIATIANHLLWEDTEGVPFATLFFLKLDGPNKSLTYAAAGHQSFVIHPSGETTALDSTAIPLGLFQETPIPSSPPRLLNSGDILLLMTDGLTETMTAGLNLFGTDRCFAVISEHRTAPAEKIIDHLLYSARMFTQEERQHDDVTIVVVKVL